MSRYCSQLEEVNGGNSAADSLPIRGRADRDALAQRASAGMLPCRRIGNRLWHKTDQVLLPLENGGPGKTRYQDG
ncbi:MAG: hypothetical protein DCC49_06835 [Acidobacteria bacterium]|nr:MAG: hypothetical protein DCC49_06835 [Acidobacteriota bacterium]